MPDLPPRPAGSDDAALSQTLTDRVLARVNDAGRSEDRRASAARPRAARRRAPADPLAAALTRTPAQVREARSLRRVFEALGISYRQYRRKTGAPVSPAVRAAACRFRKELSMPSLVVVAGRLEELHILDW
jgi:hypothetical protein